MRNFSELTLEDMTDELFLRENFPQEFSLSIDQEEHNRYYREELVVLNNAGLTIESMTTLIFSNEHEEEKGKKKEGKESEAKKKEEEEEAKLKGSFLGAPAVSILNSTINGLREGLSTAELKILNAHVLQINNLKKDFSSAKTDEKKISVNKHVLRIMKGTVGFLEKAAKLSEQTLDKTKEQYKENLKLYTMKTKKLEKSVKVCENLLKKYESE